VTTRAAPPLVSVVIPTYHRPRVLGCAIRSVLWQTFSDFELLVVGDGCTDGSAEAVERLADPRVSWHNLPANTGCQGAPNQVGLERARGTYVAYLLHDDLWRPRHLELLVSAMQRKDADFGHAILSVVGPPGSRGHEWQGLRSAGKSPRALFPTGFMHTRELGMRAGGWRHRDDSGVLPDIDFCARVLPAARRVVAVRRLTSFAFSAWCRPDSYTADPTHEQEEYLRRIEHERGFVVRELAAVGRRQIVQL
jgi:glycosyltransferase involved in cell wall biosynthesis